MKALLKPFVLAWCTLRLPFLKRRYHRLALEEIEGVPFVVLPRVFNPVLLRTGEFLVRVLASLPLPNGARVLDMGTGSGAGAVFAARRGATVVAVDINPEAVRCARMNVLLNRLEEQVEVREGDLTVPIRADERFDLVLFNPPYFRGEPKDELDFAWRGRDVLERFARELPAILTPHGRALVVFSTDGEWAAARQALEEQGFAVNEIEHVDFINEVVTAYLVEQTFDNPGA